MEKFGNAQNPNEVVVARTAKCNYCGEHGEVKMLLSEYQALLLGGHVQNALPNHSIGDREMVISGTHPECWDKLWAEDEEEDDAENDDDGYEDKYYYGTEEDQRK